jgi:hypothetical protein
MAIGVLTPNYVPRQSRGNSHFGLVQEPASIRYEQGRLDEAEAMLTDRMPLDRPASTTR